MKAGKDGSVINTLYLFMKLFNTKSKSARGKKRE